jgi:hypothetical protein
MYKLHILCVIFIAISFINTQTYTRINAQRESQQKKEERKKNYASKGERRRGPNGEILSEYEEEIVRQQELDDAQSLLDQFQLAQQRYFNNRRDEFTNALDQAESQRRQNFARNQISKF